MPHESWFAATGSRFATCPIIQGGLIRLLIGEGQTAATAGTLRHVFWPDNVPCLDVPAKGIAGHRQVTDACLASPLVRTEAGSPASAKARPHFIATSPAWFPSAGQRLDGHGGHGYRCGRDVTRSCGGAAVSDMAERQ